MTDQTIPAGLTRDEAQAVREWAELALTVWAPDQPVAKAARVALEALLHAPTLPTLADMTDEEREECQWMQADVDGEIAAGIITMINPTDAHLIASDGETWFLAHDTVTPRPDLPRLEWPEATPTAPDHLAVGTVIESANDPRIAALPAGSVLRDCDGETVAKRSGEWRGIGYVPIPSEGAEFGPWKVMRIGWEADQ